MKHFQLFIALVILHLISCSEGTNSVNPDDPSNLVVDILVDDSENGVEQAKLMIQNHFYYNGL